MQTKLTFAFLMSVFVLLCQPVSKPHVFIGSQSAAPINEPARFRNQSMEMAKDFEEVCPNIQLTVNADKADYFVNLNHIQTGLARDNQVQVSKKDGDVIGTVQIGTKFGTIHLPSFKGIKDGAIYACTLISADWTQKPLPTANSFKEMQKTLHKCESLYLNTYTKLQGELSQKDVDEINACKSAGFYKEK